MGKHIFCGFGFGPIQAGLFVKEAFESGHFSRIVVAEIDAALVEAVRRNGGSYFVNVAGSNSIQQTKIDAVELLNPAVDKDRQVLAEALAQATEIATSLPSVDFYDRGANASVASLIAETLFRSKAGQTIIYTAENNNHAAEILEKAVVGKTGKLPSNRVQFLNTVIGKMSQVVTQGREIEQRRLAPIAPGFERAFLVEEFNKILVTRTRLAGFTPGIEVFIEKDDLLPFEEAKLYGHNAIHALLGFLAALRGYTKMPQLRTDEQVMRIGREAFLHESGAALIRKYGNLGDELFTEPGYRGYAEDLLERMTNPYLDDAVARTTRDVIRKLGINDRIFGTMALALEYGIEPTNMALGAMAGIALLLENADEYNLPLDLRCDDWRRLDGSSICNIILWLWQGRQNKFAGRMIGLVQQALRQLENALMP